MDDAVAEVIRKLLAREMNISSIDHQVQVDSSAFLEEVLLQVKVLSPSMGQLDDSAVLEEIKGWLKAKVKSEINGQMRVKLDDFHQAVKGWAREILNPNGKLVDKLEDVEAEIREMEEEIERLRRMDHEYRKSCCTSSTCGPSRSGEKFVTVRAVLTRQLLKTSVDLMNASEVIKCEAAIDHTAHCIRLTTTKLNLDLANGFNA